MYVDVYLFLFRGKVDYLLKWVVKVTYLTWVVYESPNLGIQYNEDDDFAIN